MFKPKYRVNAYRSGDFITDRDEFAEQLRVSSWFEAAACDFTGVENEDSELWVFWDEIKDANDVEHFDAVLCSIYDLADIDRCQISFVRSA